MNTPQDTCWLCALPATLQTLGVACSVLWTSGIVSMGSHCCWRTTGWLHGLLQRPVQAGWGAAESGPWQQRCTCPLPHLRGIPAPGVLCLLLRLVHSRGLQALSWRNPC